MDATDWNMPNNISASGKADSGHNGHAALLWFDKERRKGCRRYPDKSVIYLNKVDCISTNSQ